jgi:hypothetical protein
MPLPCRLPQLLHHPLAVGELALELAVAVVQVQVLEAAALGAPQEVAVVEELEVVVQVDEVFAGSLSSVRWLPLRRSASIRSRRRWSRLSTWKATRWPSAQSTRAR